MTLSHRGRSRSTTSTSGSMQQGDDVQATTQPTMRWAATKASRSTNAVTTAPTSRAAEPGVSPARQTARAGRPSTLGVGHGVTQPAPRRRRSDAGAAACHHRCRGPTIRRRCGSIPSGRRRPAALRLDWRTFAYVVLAVLGALALIAVFRNTRRCSRGSASACCRPGPRPAWSTRSSGAGTSAGASRWRSSPLAVFGLAALLVAVLGPRAVAEARKFSDQLPETIDQLEELPLVGGYLRDNQAADGSRSGSAGCPSSSPTSAWPRSPARSSAASPASPSSPSWRSPCSIDGEDLLGRFRRLLPPSRRAQADEVGGVMYRTLGRYFGGSITVAVLMGLYVLALGLAARHPARPAGRGVGDAHRPHPPGRRVPRRLVPRPAGDHPERHDGDHRRRRVRRST